MGSDVKIRKKQNRTISNLTLDRKGNTSQEHDSMLIPLIDIDEFGSSDYLLSLAVGTRVFLELDSNTVIVRHATIPLGRLDEDMDDSVIQALSKGKTPKCFIHSVEGLRNGGTAIVEIWL